MTRFLSGSSNHFGVKLAIAFPAWQHFQFSFLDSDDGQNDGYSIRSDVFLAKVSGVPRSILVSFFGEVNRFYGTVELFLGHPRLVFEAYSKYIPQGLRYFFIRF